MPPLQRTRSKPGTRGPSSARNLVLVLGDQLDPQAAAFDDFDPSLDAVWMAEVDEESTHVWSHKQRIAVFLAAMRHFREQLRASGITVHYTQLTPEVTAKQPPSSLAHQLKMDLEQLRPAKLIVTKPGDHRVEQSLRAAADELPIPIEIREDRHFLSTPAEFAEHARGRKQLRMEFFYREMRRKTGYLMNGDQPEGGEWNYDSENREAFGKKGPPLLVAAPKLKHDALTEQVLTLVRTRFATHPGKLERFLWPVTREQALVLLEHFITHLLPQFGRYQDAMWTGQAKLFHSQISSAMNLKLLDPREVIEAAEQAYRRGDVELASAEGFIRQILGWREYVRGIYWLYMPEYLERNHLHATRTLPDFYWTGETPMRCLRETITQTLETGYAHHIQRLMVTGLFALLAGIRPQEVHAWYLAVYIDAIEWVELPNTLGMSQYADGGVMASKPYVATGKYIQRMSNYCSGCQFDPALSTGEKACPFTTLYWDFLMRHEALLKKNQRMSLQVKNLARLSSDDKQKIRDQAETFLRKLTPTNSSQPSNR
ncbi:deoxyribodipyrimidine photolyase-related protein [Pirellula staleyi DSM 6068]|uniref:Deoxyribodipyrimidine photolyase-related protein n=1 Tax=Pirellula staleyi (strain ATCC 27377 / DSM 6068 / ICPB 4128) TaxID=530564 RepID=D2R3F9_PIRSD|nr:cryptochrome/photolyase family protein [Pirellula staleyi]ADB15190.1 deoxyribodipyrimidine photolyase-related protein [Pirellula staleyi DSM 6068]